MHRRAFLLQILPNSRAYGPAQMLHFMSQKEFLMVSTALGTMPNRMTGPLLGFLLVAREVASHQVNSQPALEKPLDYSLVWTSADSNEDENSECGVASGCHLHRSNGYKALANVVTKDQRSPHWKQFDVCEMTYTCENFRSIVNMDDACQIWKTRPCHRGVRGHGIPFGTFSCATDSTDSDESSTPCLKNVDSNLSAMPNLEQIHALIEHYGPTVFFHAQETYLPSSVPWFFENGAPSNACFPLELERA